MTSLHWLSLVTLSRHCLGKLAQPSAVHRSTSDQLLCREDTLSIHSVFFDEDNHLCLQVRGKTVYLQYSTRQEIVNSTRSAEQGGNVLLVSLENLAVSQHCS